MLENKIALVTGAGRGIGRAIAIAFAEEGAEVIINYNGSEERAKEVKQTIEENGGKASIYKCNVSDFAACEAMIKDNKHHFSYTLSAALLLPCPQRTLYFPDH